MVWHLAHIRAVAMRFDGSVTLVAKPRSAADQIFAAENTIADILWLDRNPEQRRGLHDGAAGFLRLVTGLRKRGFQRAVILHHSRTLAMACLAAGIPERYGYGSKLQRPFLNRRPFLPSPALRLHPFEQASAWLAAAAIPVGEVEPHLPVSEEARRTVRERLGPEPFIVLGIGSSEPYKQWGAENFAATAMGLAQAGWPRTVLAGGVREQALAAAIIARVAHRAGDVTAAVGWPLIEIAALCAEAAFYVGNDTGVMNLAAAVGARCYGLFGAVEPFAHASQIVAILPPGGRPNKADGMARITPAMVLDQIALDRRRGDLQCRIANCGEIKHIERRATQDNDPLPARRT